MDEDEDGSGWMLDFDGWPCKAVGDELTVHVKGVDDGEGPGSGIFKVSVQAGEFLEGIAGPVDFVRGFEEAKAAAEALAEKLAEALADPEATRALNGPLAKFGLLFEIKDHPERFAEQRKRRKAPRPGADEA